MNFHALKTAVAKQFDRLQTQGPLFRTNIDKDAMWNTYLGSFPPGTNELFRERTEHDCSCCRQFIRAMGDVVAVVDGKVETLWDFDIGEPGYQAVANAMSALVGAQPVADVFLHYERTAGTDKNFEQMTEGVKTWEHFFVNIPGCYVVPGTDLATRLAAPRDVHAVLLRSVREITEDSVATVLELIAQGSLYRGEEHKGALEAFAILQRKFKGLPEARQSLLAWSALASVPVSIAKIRNSAIGTLLVDLSEGRELEAAVASFEVKVAPTNYKRPTALITPRMVEQAKAKITELGLLSALDRRYARLDDITINNVVFADRSARKVMGGDVFDDLAPAAAAPKNLDKVEEVTIDRFLAEILPMAETVEVMLENSHASNMVSLIAPMDPTAGHLFKWGNNFSWSYSGELADSIKERVKQAGGSVVGDLCCRLAWSNFDDLDIHMIEPDGYHLYFGTRRSASPSGGHLDVDMNAGSGATRDAVENIYYERRAKMQEGNYHLFVNNFAKRENVDVGFEVEIDYLGEVHRYAYPSAVPNGKNVTVAKFNYTHAAGIRFIEALSSTAVSRPIWGLPSNAFHRVSCVLLSPNHWDGQGVGNKHFFFMLDGAKNDGTARGFFNEFLKEDLNVHRKVFEVVGGKMKVPDTADQLSGLGFSSTQPAALVCRVKGSFTRTIKVVF